MIFKFNIIYLSKIYKFKIKIFKLFIILLELSFYYLINYNVKKKRIGVVGLINEQNVGNILVKYSMYIKLKEYNFEPFIISTKKKTSNLDFLKKNVKLKEVKNSFSELKRNDYDILMVNSDQTWSTIVQKQFLYDYGFLKFAENWTIPKFVYGASLGIDYWQFSKDFDEKAKSLLKNFTGVSLRENGAIKLVEEHLNIKPIFVLDPTFLIDKKYYLNIIENYKKDFNFNTNYICVYELDNNNIINEFIKECSKNLNYKIYNINLNSPKYIEEFIFCINISKAIITDSFHGTVFSIIFNKPFISFINSRRGRGRFFSLIETFNLKDRIIFPTNESIIDTKLLITPLIINRTKLTELKDISINYLQKNLGIFHHNKISYLFLKIKKLFNFIKEIF